MSKVVEQFERILDNRDLTEKERIVALKRLELDIGVLIRFCEDNDVLERYEEIMDNIDKYINEE